MRYILHDFTKIYRKGMLDIMKLLEAAAFQERFFIMAL